MRGAEVRRCGAGVQRCEVRSTVRRFDHGGTITAVRSRLGRARVRGFELRIGVVTQVTLETGCRPAGPRCHVKQVDRFLL